MPAFKVVYNTSWLMVLHYEYITNGTTTQLDPAKILLKYSCQSNLIQIPNKEKLATVLPGS